MKDFPPVLSMRLAYTINNGEPEVIDLMKQKKPSVQLIIYGENLPTKDPEIYKLVDGKIDIKAYPAIQFLVFNFNEISKTEIEEMTITYGLWEKKNIDKRTEKTFELKLKR